MSLKIFGSMQIAHVAQSRDDLQQFQGLALKAGADPNHIQAKDDKLYVRAIYMGYDLPNGNGDAVPRKWAHTFGPSFIGTRVDQNHWTDPANIIGKTLTTWHREQDVRLTAAPGGETVGALKASRIIGRDAFGWDIPGRPEIFGLPSAIEGMKELQVEGIFEIDRTSKLGDEIARKLIAGVLNSVSQEADTDYCMCPICAHKVATIYDPPCMHMVYGSIMAKTYKVPGYDVEILAHKIHHNPVGTGLGVVGVGAYDLARVHQLTAQLKQGTLSLEAAKKVLEEQVLIYGNTTIIDGAMKEVNSIAASQRIRSSRVTIALQASSVREGNADDPMVREFLEGHTSAKNLNAKQLRTAHVILTDHLTERPKGTDEEVEAVLASEKELLEEVEEAMKALGITMKAEPTHPWISKERSQENWLHTVLKDAKNDGLTKEQFIEKAKNHMPVSDKMKAEVAEEASKLWDAKQGVSAGSQVIVSFSKKENTKGAENDEVEVKVKPDSEIVGKVLGAAGFAKVADGLYAMHGNNVQVAKKAFEDAVFAQDKSVTGISIMESSDNALVVEHISPKEPVPMAAVNAAGGLRHVRITYDDGNVVDTNMAAGVTDEEIKSYYAVGKEFNVGSGEHDKMAKVAKVEILASLLKAGDDFLQALEMATDSQLAAFITEVEGDENGFVYVNEEARKKAGTDDEDGEGSADYYELADAGRDVMIPHIMEHRDLYEPKWDRLEQMMRGERPSQDETIQAVQGLVKDGMDSKALRSALVTLAKIDSHLNAEGILIARQARRAKLNAEGQVADKEMALLLASRTANLGSILVAVGNAKSALFSRLDPLMAAERNARGAVHSLRAGIVKAGAMATLEQRKAYRDAEAALVQARKDLESGRKGMSSALTAPDSLAFTAEAMDSLNAALPAVRAFQHYFVLADPTDVKAAEAYRSFTAAKAEVLSAWSKSKASGFTAGKDAVAKAVTALEAERSTWNNFVAGFGDMKVVQTVAAFLGSAKPSVVGRMRMPDGMGTVCQAFLASPTAEAAKSVLHFLAKALGIKANIWPPQFANLNEAFDAAHKMGWRHIGVFGGVDWFQAPDGTEGGYAGQGPTYFIGEKPAVAQPVQAAKTEKCNTCGRKLDPDRGDVFLTDDGGVYCNDCYPGEEEASKPSRKKVKAVFVRRPVVAHSYWMVQNTAGKVLGRWTLAQIGGADLTVKAQGMDVPLAKHLSSENYGKDLVAYAEQAGVDGLLAELNRAPKAEGPAFTAEQVEGFRKEHGLDAALYTEADVREEMVLAGIQATKVADMTWEELEALGERVTHQHDRLPHSKRFGLDPLVDKIQDRADELLKQEKNGVTASKAAVEQAIKDRFALTMADLALMDQAGSEDQEPKTDAEWAELVESYGGMEGYLSHLADLFNLNTTAVTEQDMEEMAKRGIHRSLPDLKDIKLEGAKLRADYVEVPWIKVGNNLHMADGKYYGTVMNTGAETIQITNLETRKTWREMPSDLKDDLDNGLLKVIAAAGIPRWSPYYKKPAKKKAAAQPSNGTWVDRSTDTEEAYEFLAPAGNGIGKVWQTKPVMENGRKVEWETQWGWAIRRGPQQASGKANSLADAKAIVEDPHANSGLAVRSNLSLRSRRVGRLVATMRQHEGGFMEIVGARLLTPKVKANIKGEYKIAYKGKEYDILDEQGADPEVGIPTGYFVFVPEGAPEEGYTIDMPAEPGDDLKVYDENGKVVGTGSVVRAAKVSAEPATLEAPPKQVQVTVYAPHEQKADLQKVKDYLVSKESAYDEASQQYTDSVTATFFPDVDKADDPEMAEFMALVNKLGLKVKQGVASALNTIKADADDDMEDLGDEDANQITWGVNVEKNPGTRGDDSSIDADITFDSDAEIPDEVIERIKKALLGKEVPPAVAGYPGEIVIEEGDYAPISFKVIDMNDYRQSEMSGAALALENHVTEVVEQALAAEFGAENVTDDSLTVKAGLAADDNAAELAQAARDQEVVEEHGPDERGGAEDKRLPKEEPEPPRPVGSTLSDEKIAKRLAELQAIVDNKSMGKVDGKRVDLFSANAILSVYKALSDTNKKKLLSLNVPKMASVAFSLLQ